MSERKVPKLRFPEFSGDWEDKKLNNIAIKCTKKNRDNNIVHVLTNSAVNGVVAQSDFFDKEIANSSNLNGYWVVDKFDFVYNPRISVSAPVGPINCNNSVRGVMSPLYTVFKFLYGYIKYYEQYFKSNSWHSYMRNIANYGARDDRMNITSNDFFNMPIKYPIVDEQTKIADFLTSIDNKIQQLTKKKELLEQYKKGVMVDIFNQKIRFKDDYGNDYPDWNYLGGDLLFDSISDKNHNSNLPVLAITQEHGAIPRDLIDYNISVTDKSVSSYKVVNVGDFIISLRSFQGGVEYSNYKGICSPAYIILRNKIEVDKYFYKLYFKTNFYISMLNKNIEGIRDGKMVSYSQFSDIELPYPSLDEQHKIANFLTSIDNKITLVNTQLEQTKLFKKSLLQQMFI